MSLSTDFLFAEFKKGKPIEVLRVGTFVDRHGRTVEVSEEDLDAFVANFETGAVGQEVPIDVNHEKGEAGGWIRKLTREDEKLLAVPEWNELGKKLVGGKIYRYLSATIDLAKKVIKSVSLVNFPAVKGLKPVELGEGVYRLEAEAGLLERILSAVTATFQKPDVVQCECLQCGYVLETEEHCADIRCPECGGEMRRVERPGPGRLAEFVIRKEDNEIVLYSSDGEKVLGRFPFGKGEKYASEKTAREAANKRERQIQYFRHRKTGEFEDAWAELQSNIKAIVGAWRRWAGSFDKCVRELKGKPGIDDPEALCAWLHKQAEGKWPAEASDHSPPVIELEALVAALSDVIQISGGDTMTDEERAELEEKIRQDILAEMAEKEKTVVELKEQIRAEVEAEMAERFKKRDELREFAGEITSGDFGLSTKPEEVVELLEGIEDEEQLKRVQEMLKAKVVDFTEHGSSRDGQGDKKKLAEPFAVQLGEWLAADQGLEEWFEVNKDVLGEADDYDLSEFEKKKDD